MIMPVSFATTTRLALAGVAAMLGLGYAMPGAKPPEAPEAVVAAVYVRSLRGLPTGREWQELKPRLSQDFVAAIARAQALQAREIAENPGEKPSWIEGDFFSSLFEGPDSHKIGPALVHGERAEVPVACSHSEGGATIRWSDRFLLVREGGRWRIDDVMFGGTWDFASKGSLKAALR
jgi:hypothetical protein